MTLKRFRKTITPKILVKEDISKLLPITVVISL